MESLQIAQILADLSDLQNTDPAAATTLLTSHRLPPSTHTHPSSSTQSLNSLQTQPQPQTAKFDRLGRRIISPSRGVGTPPLTRASSSISGFVSPLGRHRSASGVGNGGDSGKGSGAQTPSGENEGGANIQTDEDLRRARTLLELFEQRGRFKQMGDTGLLRSKERVDAVAARYAKRELEEKEKEKEKALRLKYLAPRS